MAARLNLLCHAATTATRGAAFPAGDEAADAAGLRRLKAVAQRLPTCPHWLTSPGRAAIETAAVLQPQRATIEPALRDCDYGSWKGRAFDSVQTTEPDAVMAWLRDPRAAPHGGESLAGLLSRVAAWLETRLAATGACLAVTHPAVIRAAIVLAIEAEPRSFWRIDIAPLSLTRLSAQASHWTLVSVGPVAP